MKSVLGIDPSLTCTGYAVLQHDWPREVKLIDAGRIRVRAASASSIDRISQIIADLVAVYQEHAPDDVVIEVTTGKTQRKKQWGGSGLGTYGMCVGAVWQYFQRPEFTACHPVYENQWTGRVGKAARASIIRRMFPGYDASRDPGHDVADAIGLAYWFITHRSHLQ